MIVSALIYIALIIALEFLKPKPDIENARPGGLGDFQFPTAEEGRHIPVIWGTVKVNAPNLIWYGELVVNPIQESFRTGLFSKQKSVIGYKYTLGFQLAFCVGQVDSLKRIWVDDNEVYSGTLTGGNSTTIQQPNLFGEQEGGIVGTVYFYDGSFSQGVDSYLDEKLGDVPAYRGTCNLVGRDVYVGNSTRMADWKAELRRIPTQLGATDSVVNTHDANPAHAMYELLTNTDWGFGHPAADIDTTSFTDAADTLESEGTGFSFLMDRPMEADDLKKEMERVMDGVAYEDKLTGKWKIKLARLDYSVGSLPSIDETNRTKVKKFDRGSWSKTINQIKIGFMDRDRDYFSTSAQATDRANVHIQGNVVSDSKQYPGIKDKTQANNTAWRELRARSIPLATAVIEVDRTFYDLHPLDVVKWSDDGLDITDMVMRVMQINQGKLEDGPRTPTLKHDVFSFQASAFGDPPDTGWTVPTVSATTISSANILAFETPALVIYKAQEIPGPSNYGPFIVMALDPKDGTFGIDALSREGADEYLESSYWSTEYAFKGTLASATTIGSANPLPTLDIVPSPSTQSEIFNAFDRNEGRSIEDLEGGFHNMLYVDGEFMLAEGAELVGNNVRLTNVYRGLMDTVPKAHSASTVVWMFWGGGAMAYGYRGYEAADVVDLRLRSYSYLGVSNANAGTKQLTYGSTYVRSAKAEPPSELKINGTRYDPDADMNDQFTGGSGLDERGLEISFVRRVQRGTQFSSSLVTGSLEEHANIDYWITQADYQYKAKLTEDPTGTPNEIEDKAWNTGENVITFSRTKILRETNGVIPTDPMRVEVSARKKFDSSNYAQADLDLTFDFDISDTVLAGDHNFGVMASGVTSPNSWTAPDTGTYAFEIGNALTVGKVQARLNGGGWTDVITSGTTGNLAGVTATDTIEVRHTGTNNVDETLLRVDSPTSATDAYAVLTF